MKIVHFQDLDLTEMTKGTRIERNKRIFIIEDIISDKTALVKEEYAESKEKDL